MAKRQKNRRLESRFGERYRKTTHHKKPKEVVQVAKLGFFDTHFKRLMIIPIIVLVLAILSLSLQYANTGELVNRGISLKGGSAITITHDAVDLSTVDIKALESSLQLQFPDTDVNIREQKSFSQRVAIEISTDITDEEKLDDFKTGLLTAVPGVTQEALDDNVSISGSTLGNSFFRQISSAILIAFILMGVVVFIQFKQPTPSLAVIIAVFSDLIITLAVVNIVNIKLSTAGIAAFLMLIGYSVDTNILLSTRMVKSEGPINARFIDAFKTGITMNITTLAAVSAGLLFSQSEIIRQIMQILFIGLIVDMLTTWVLNSGILRIYVAKRMKYETKGDN